MLWHPYRPPTLDVNGNEDTRYLVRFSTIFTSQVYSGPPKEPTGDFSSNHSPGSERTNAVAQRETCRSAC